ncbi:MAG: adenosine deaminase [Candidatus Sericytochromatia bacterium]|nr:adenosine deaminase [Candidatus Sericytochromatia bacterium]
MLPPLVDLHLHLDGALRPSTIVELASSLGLDGEEIVAGLAAIGAGRLDAYLAHFDAVLPLLQNAPALARVAEEAVLDAADQGLGHVEVRICPWQHQKDGLTLERATRAILEGLQAGSRKTGLPAPMIVCLLHGMNEQEANDLADLAVRLRPEGVAGLDLAGNESGGYRIEVFRRAFAVAAEGGLRRTVHAGEAGPGVHVRRAILELGAERIGHGTSILEDEEAVALARDRGVTLECCLSSNLHTGAIARLEDHPLRAMMAAGLKVTLNTDNPTLSRTTLAREWALARQYLGLTEEEEGRLRQWAWDARFEPTPRLHRTGPLEEAR